jgi:hypothetical protein
MLVILLTKVSAYFTNRRIIEHRIKKLQHFKLLQIGAIIALEHFNTKCYKLFKYTCDHIQHFL